MKVNKYIIGMFVATATFFVSCNTDNEGDIYNSTTMGVTFATGTQSVSFPSTGYEGFDVEVLRAKSSEATTINLSATLVVGDKEQELPASITVPSSVSFAAGEFKTNIHVTVGDITPGQNYKVKISLPEEMVTIDQTSDKVITVYRDYTFSSLGTGTFKSAAMAEEGEDFATWEVEVQKADLDSEETADNEESATQEEAESKIELLTAGGLSAEEATTGGNAEFVSVYTPDNTDADVTTYATDSYSGVEITNQLQDCKADVTYLTRSDWEGTFPTHDGTPGTQISTWGNEINGEDGVSYTYVKTASDDLIAELDSFSSGTEIDPETLADTQIVYGADNSLTLIDMRGLDYNDPLWEDLLDELTPEEIYNTIGVSGYGIEYIDSVEKPFNIDADTASGLIYGGTGAMFPSAMTLAQTWNLELASEYGEMIGNEGLLGGADGWYAPSMNIHRTPYSGRNGEYYSEDAFLSGAVASREIYGAASKGMYTYIKHFAFNDQENHRGDRDGQFSVATWFNEQSAREIYLVPFEMCMKAGDVTLNYVEKQEDRQEPGG